MRSFVQGIGVIFLLSCMWLMPIMGKEEGHRITGNVMDENGNSVVGASFSLYQYGAVVRENIQTDDKGKFTITDVEPGEYVLLQDKSPNGFERMQKEQKIHVGEDMEVKLQTIRNPHMKGDVWVHLQDESGKPVKGLEIRVLNEAQACVYQGHTNANGDMQVEQLPIGSYVMDLVNSEAYEKKETLQFTVSAGNYQQLQKIYYHLTKKNSYVKEAQPALYVFLSLCGLVVISVWWYLHRHDFSQLKHDFM